MQIKDLAKEYRPYDALAAFWQGVSDYGSTYRNPFDGDPAKGVDAQAWDRGLECASRFIRMGNAPIAS